jgi:hypothetical protein
VVLLCASRAGGRLGAPSCWRRREQPRGLPASHTLHSSAHQHGEEAAVEGAVAPSWRAARGGGARRARAGGPGQAHRRLASAYTPFVQIFSGTRLRSLPPRQNVARCSALYIHVVRLATSRAVPLPARGARAARAAGRATLDAAVVTRLSCPPPGH